MKTKQTAKTADTTWVYVEPYLYKNADSGRYYSRFGRQGFRALKTDRVTVARLLLADRAHDHKGRIDLHDAGRQRRCFGRASPRRAQPSSSGKKCASSLRLAREATATRPAIRGVDQRLEEHRAAVLSATSPIIPFKPNPGSKIGSILEHPEGRSAGRQDGESESCRGRPMP